MPSIRPLSLLAALLAFAPSARAQAWLDAPRQLLEGDPPEFRALGDIDGDGDVDLLAVEGLPSSGHFTSLAGIASVTPHFYAGPDQLVAGPTTPVVSPGNQPGRDYILLGDVTGDGLADLVLDDREFDTPAHAILVMVNLGGGAFADPVVVSAGGISISAALADRDGDGDLELAEVHSPDTTVDVVQWWDWNGTTLVGSATVTLVADTETVAAGDVTGDGVPDIVVGDWFEKNVYVLETLPSGDPQLLHTIFVPGESNGRGVHLADTDADGDLDLVASWQAPVFGSDEHHLSVIENLGGAQFSVGPDQEFPETVDVNDFRGFLSDWDADGDPDFLIAYDNLLMLENVGGNTFAFGGVIRLEPGLPSSIFGDGSYGAGLVDVDANGFPDYVGGHVVKYSNGLFEDATDYYPSLASPGLARDLDGDGDLDFLQPGGDLMANDAQGDFTDAGDQIPAAPSPFLFLQAGAFGDLDGDGRGDFLVENWELVGGPFGGSIFRHMRRIAGTATGDFVDAGQAAPEGSIIGSYPVFGLGTVDLDGDGDQDVLHGDERPVFTFDGWWENDGTGFLATQHLVYDGRPVAVADFDGDGDADLLTYEDDLLGNTSLALQDNQGAGAAFTTTLLANDVAGTGDLYDTARFVDLDADGDLDAAVGSEVSGSRVLLFENLGGGTMVQATELTSTTRSVGALGFDDFDGDGLLDVLGAPTLPDGVSGDTWRVWRRSGPGLAYEDGRAFFALAGRHELDVDSDGDPDFVARGIVESWRENGPDAGRIRQYGAGSPGTGGYVPLLGASGPVRVGEPGLLHVRRGLGGSVAVLAYGTGEDAVADFPLPGLTLYLSGLLRTVPLPLGGTPGAGGEGALDVPYAIPPPFAGLRLFLEVFVVDPGVASFVTHSNGLEVLHGT